MFVQKVQKSPADVIFDGKVERRVEPDNVSGTAFPGRRGLSEC